MTTRKPAAMLVALTFVGCGMGAERIDTLQGADATAAAHHDTSPPLFLIPPAERIAPTDHEVKPIPRAFHRGPAVDLALQPRSTTPLALTVSSSFDGVGNGFVGPSGTFTVNAAPPDTNGDVGPNHYVQTVNTDYAVFDKTGKALFGPVPINTLFNGFGGLCQSTNDGDPIVIYDPISDRWLVSQFAVTGANGGTVPYLQCVAVSTSGDPTGSYFRYSFPYADFPDYPKFGVWPDAYYVTFNMFRGGNTFSGGQVCAYDRAKMLTGAAATQQCFNVGTSYGGILAADLDGKTLPPAGSSEYIVGLGATAGTVAYWTMHTDWTTPANTTLTGPVTLTVAGYSEACAGGTCIPQPGTNQQLDSLADRMMYRLAYRNQGSYQSLVTNHSVVAGASSGVRWYELRVSGSSLSIFQQGTYAPDSNYRWMGSAAMDKAGNIALGYSVSSSTVKPGLHFTARLAGDAAGTMTQGENVLYDGAGVQTAGLARWGDYSMLGVDPVDDCTFWFTSEYEPSNGTFNWHTRIGTFTLPGCSTPPPANDFSISASPSAVSVLQGNSTTSTLSATTTAGAAQTVTWSASGLPAGATASFNPASVTSSPAPGTASTMTIATSTTTPAGTYPITVTGSGSAGVTHTTTVTLTVTSPPTADFAISVSPGSQTVHGGSSASYTVTVTPSNGFTGNVALSVSGQPSGSTATFSPPSIAGGSGTSTLTIATATRPRGTYTLTITGTSGSLTHSTTATLTVTK